VQRRAYAEIRGIYDTITEGTDLGVRLLENRSNSAALAKRGNLHQAAAVDTEHALIVAQTGYLVLKIVAVSNQLPKLSSFAKLWSYTKAIP